MATIKFLLQSEKSPAQIYLRLSIGANRVFKRKAGYLVDPKNWDSRKDKGEPLGKSAEASNLRANLGDLKNHVIRQYNTDYPKGENIDGEWLQGVINSFFNRTESADLNCLVNYGRKYVEELHNIKPDSVSKYKNAVESVAQFEKVHKKTFLVKDVNIDFRNRFHHFLLTRPVNPLSESTAVRTMKFVKTIVYHARNNGIEISPQIYSVKGIIKPIPKVTLTRDEIEDLRRMEYSDDRYDIARDWLVISCYTAQRSSDLLKMNKSMIQKHGKHSFIVLQQKKTDANLFLPIHPHVQEILDKRNGEFPPAFANDDSSNTAMYNRYLKTVCELANINSPAKGNLRNKETGVYGTGIFPKWQLVTSHIGRRSFVTNFYVDDKLSTPLLMNVTGHSTERTFLQYNGNQSLDYATKLAEIWTTE